MKMMKTVHARKTDDNILRVAEPARRLHRAPRVISHADRRTKRQNTRGARARLALAD
jgi:hypothetical protein